MEQLQHKYAGSTRPVFFKSMPITQIEVNDFEVQGYLAAFNNKDLDNDVILAGAFKKSLNERGPQSKTARKIAYLWAHDLKSPVGVFSELWEDSHGLAFKGILDPTDLGERLAIQYKTGSVNNHSIGFKYVWDKMEAVKEEDGSKTFYSKEINLFEGSATPVGVNENTPYTGKKSQQLYDDRVILTHETEIFLKSLSAEMEYQARQIIAKHIALVESKPPAALTESEPFDLATAIKNAKIL